jgi:hypothetical protein
VFRMVIVLVFVELVVSAQMLNNCGHSGDCSSSCSDGGGGVRDGGGGGGGYTTHHKIRAVIGAKGDRFNPTS